MKKPAALILLLALCLNLCACGEQKETVSMYELQKVMVSAAELPEMLSASSSDSDAKAKFAYLSDFDYSKTDGFFLAYSADGSSYEIAVIATKSSSDALAAEASLRRHLQSRINLYKTYEPTQLDRAENAMIISSGRYAALIMCDDNSAVKAAFTDFIK